MAMAKTNAKSTPNLVIHALTALLGAGGLAPFVWAMYRALLHGELPGARPITGLVAHQSLVLALSIVTAGLLLCAIIGLRRFKTAAEGEAYNPPSFSTGVAIVLIGAALAAITVGSSRLEPSEESSAARTGSPGERPDPVHASLP
jgi:hypothetical protein